MAPKLRRRALSWSVMLAMLRDVARERSRQALPNRRPFVGKDRVEGRIPDRAIGAQHLCPPDALELRADPLDRAARVYIALVRLERHAGDAPHLERVSQQEKFRFGVAACSLRGLRKPCRADLNRRGHTGRAARPFPI